MIESVGVASARKLLRGQQVSALCFVRDYVELHFDGPVFRAFSDPFGRHGCVSWNFPDGNSMPLMRSYIGETVDGFVLEDDRYAQLSFGEHSFTVPLDDATRRGPEALHIVGVDGVGNTNTSGGIWIW